MTHCSTLTIKVVSNAYMRHTCTYMIWVTVGGERGWFLVSIEPRSNYLIVCVSLTLCALACQRIKLTQKKVEVVFMKVEQGQGPINYFMRERERERERESIDFNLVESCRVYSSYTCQSPISNLSKHQRLSHLGKSACKAARRRFFWITSRIHETKRQGQDSMLDGVQTRSLCAMQCMAKPSKNCRPIQYRSGGLA